MDRLTVLALLAGGLAIGGLGCTGGSSDYKKTTELTKAPAEDHHEHGAKGPHGGSLVELGEEEFHGEVVLDHDAHALRVFVLGKDAKSPALTEATEITLTPNGKDALTLKAVAQDGDGAGKSSRFELVDEEVVDALLDSGAIHGVLRVTIGEKPYSGEVDYHLDDIHHEHKDEKPAAKAETTTDSKPEEKTEGEAAKEKPAEAAKEPESKQ